MLNRIGLALFVIAGVCVLARSILRWRQVRRGTRFRCWSGLVDLRQRALPRFVQLYLVNLNLTESRLVVNTVLIVGRPSPRSSLVATREETQFLLLEPIEFTSMERQLRVGCPPELLGRVVGIDGTKRSMSFLISARNGERLREHGTRLGWVIVLGEVTRPSPLSADLDRFS